MKLIPKGKYLLELFLMEIILFLTSFLFLYSSMRNSAIKYTHNQIVQNLRLDYKILAPTENQIKEISKLKCIDKIYPYYETSSDILLNNTNIGNSRILIIPLEYSDSFPLIGTKFLIKGKAEINSNSVLIEYNFFKKNQVKENDLLDIEIGNKTSKYRISGVVNNFTEIFPSLNQNIIIIVLDTNTIKDLAGKNISYSGAFIRCIDKSETRDYLKTYKPYGRLKSRNDFESDEEYNDYLDFFKTGNYQAEIENFENINILDNSNRNLIQSLIYLVVEIIILIFIFASILSDKQLKNNVENLYYSGEELTSIKKSINTHLLFPLYLIIISIIVSIFYFYTLITDYCPASNYCYLSGINIISFAVIGYGLKFLFVRQSLKKVEGVYKELNHFENIQKIKKNEIKTSEIYENGQPIFIKILENYKLTNNDDITLANSLDISKYHIDILIFGTTYTEKDSEEKISNYLKKQQSTSKSLLKLSKNKKYLQGDVLLDYKPIVIKYTKRQEKNNESFQFM